jgi:hypothetical protein
MKLSDLSAIALAMTCLALGKSDARAADADPNTIWNVASNKQLFIDHRFIVASTNVRLVANAPQLAGPALEPGSAGSWDDAKVTWGQVMQDQGVFKMWAGGFSAKAMKGDWQELEVQMRLGYATSQDGIHWKKPNLGLFEWNGSKENNITCLDLGYVMIDPKAKPEQRYKMLCTGPSQIGARTIWDALKPESGGLYFYTSPDGIRWKWNPKMVFPFHPDTLNQIDYDERIGKYVAYIRSWPNGFLFKKTYGRAVGRLELDDPLNSWPYDASVKPVKPWGPKYIATPGKEIPVAFTFPDYDQEGVWTDVYNPCVSVYPWAQDVYFAFPSLNHYLAQSSVANDSTLNIGMVASRDGIHWHWPSTEPYIPMDAPGSGRSGQLYALVGMLKVGDRIYQYHAATDLRHNTDWSKNYTLEQLQNIGRIYRTVQRLDGFVSADFVADGGELTTPLLRFTGSTLRLNVNAAKGSGGVEIQDAEGRPITGFEWAACKPLQSDSVDQLVSWKSGSDLSALRGKAVRLRFVMNDAKLYGFQFADAARDESNSR